MSQHNDDDNNINTINNNVTNDSNNDDDKSNDSSGINGQESEMANAAPRAKGISVGNALSVESLPSIVEAQTGHGLRKNRPHHLFPMVEVQSGHELRKNRPQPLLRRVEAQTVRGLRKNHPQSLSPAQLEGGGIVGEEDRDSINLLKMTDPLAATFMTETTSMIPEQIEPEKMNPFASQLDVAVPETVELRRRPHFTLEGIPGAHHVGNMDGSTTSSDDEGPLQEPSVADRQPIEFAPGNQIVALEIEDESPKQVAFPLTGNNPRSHIQYLVLTFVILSAIIVIVVGTMCGVGFCSRSGSKTASSSTMASSSYRHAYVDTFKQKIERAMGPNYFKEEIMEAPQGKALQWIVYEDPLQLEPDNEDMLQRFALVAFYFATTQKRPWTYCNPPQKDQTELCLYPVYQYDKFEYQAIRWLSGTSVCQWAGVVCNEGMVSQLRLSNFDAHGLIPRELTMLSQLTLLSLSNNQLTGTIPATLFQLAQSLTKIVLSSNLLTGPLPSEMGLFPKTDVRFDYNQLTGSLPSELFGLDMLEWLVLNDNDIHGTISPLIGKLSTLYNLMLDNTQLTGSLPSEVALLDSLVGLYLANTNLQGTIPEELYAGAKNLQATTLDRCQFSGTLSTKIGLLTRLSRFEVANNKFEGIVPTELSLLSNLELVTLNGNNFTGTFPEEVCTNLPVKLGYSLVADCTPDEVTGVVAMACSCCTQCCEPATGICSDVIR